MKFYSAYALLITTWVILSITAINLCVANPEFTSMLYTFLVSPLWGFSLLGMGLGFIILLIATLFSWVQLYLLITGSIDPHLAQSDFFKALEIFMKTLFGYKAG
ncbi:hypothetical protein CC99x_011110 [Candidatus Berkiella cookevillensis]|uniref:Uncharacterized protein n=1 Tax=Candidatus Berkiella cookevillensis TaxID=437022 RepID=A0A0Q9YT24_9GAMM|nr:hypothetical protein [Candidatus Berkiella cookevillensis]MCS5709445.1 hypothetical protein [Candidatus Berkiella cookevillensis]